MKNVCLLLLLSCASLCLPSGDLHASDACPAPLPVGQVPAPGYAARIVDIACREHRLWFQPFIDRQGRLASATVMEAERDRLADGSTEAWQRVVLYWRASGTLYALADDGITGASSCMYPETSRQFASDCRAFLLDNPWSAAFVSYVMMQAHVTGFRPSPRHIDYVRDAWRAGNGSSPYVFSDPATQKPAPGDLLCFARDRSSTTYGYQRLAAMMDSGSDASLQMHCDIVVAVDPRLRTLAAIGGNVLNGVTMRKMTLDAQAYLILPPAPAPRAAVANAVQGDMDSGTDTGACSPQNEGACNFNRQNWSALLKLKPQPVAPTPLTQAGLGSQP